jgi:hypothetical protein
MTVAGIRLVDWLRIVSASVLAACYLVIAAAVAVHAVSASGVVVYAAFASSAVLFALPWHVRLRRGP